jgi:hypothetical protein
VNSAGIFAGEKAGAAGRANGALAIGVGKGHPVFYQPVDVGCANVFIAQSAQGVKTLLISANPKNIRLQGEFLQLVVFTVDALQ